MTKLLMFLLGNLFAALSGSRRQPLDGVGVSGADAYDEANRKAIERLERRNNNEY